MQTPGNATRDFDRKLAGLIAKERAAQEQSPLDIDWDQPAKRPFWLPKQVAAAAITQFQRGEWATATMCHQLRHRLDFAAGGDFLDLQREDERRHACLYGLYLDKLGGPAPQRSAIAAAYEQALSWPGAPQAIILAFHGILEGESMRLQHAIDRWLPCPLFREISTVVARDEARHIAFGRLYLQESLPSLPRAERLRILRWARGLWFDAVGDAISSFAPPGFVRPHGGLAGWMAAEWGERLDDLEALHLFSADERPDFVGAC